jgi:hypothetical protein
MVITTGSPSPVANASGDPQIAHNDTRVKADHHHPVVRRLQPQTTSSRSVALAALAVVTQRVHQQQPETASPGGTRGRLGQRGARVRDCSDDASSFIVCRRSQPQLDAPAVALDRRGGSDLRRQLTHPAPVRVSASARSDACDQRAGGLGARAGLGADDLRVRPRRHRRPRLRSRTPPPGVGDMLPATTLPRRYLPRTAVSGSIVGRFGVVTQTTAVARGATPCGRDHAARPPRPRAGVPARDGTSRGGAGGRPRVAVFRSARRPTQAA